ncbi:Secreted protein containing C-terminal beta-propeller domain [Micromonospora pattaloongensis]|uniref:Secreted protein containing C-terminal beta-propeller domain n=1 Tax=Micromonospora pattaloongensis TaxID=405436 RepID=A0A1H3HQC4_9ACTN|nr:beta-propeller domain-containing protein [Micromonospora pattaloongensis]SDY17721.1 Secreted protein containing C-terminal beta-propeller domain [Micromonospora pattaloongensis]
MTPRRRLAAGVAVLLLAGCDAAPRREPAQPAPPLRLVAFDSCTDVLAGLRAAAKKSVGPWGLPGSIDYSFRTGLDRGGNPAAAAESAAGGGAPAGPDHSGTNTHEAGVDEPDIVKTDGRRIVTVSAGVLRSVDPHTRRVTGELALATGDEAEGYRWAQSSLLLHGDRALVLISGHGRGGARPDIAGDSMIVAGPERPVLLLVDLAGAPKLLGRYRIDGALVDARQVGGAARVVVRSSPRLTFPAPRGGTDAQRLAANREAIDAAPIEAWLPRYEIDSGGRTTSGRIGCDRLRHPDTYSGTSMVTVLSFDLTRPEFGDGDPLTVLADGDTVYSNGANLYVVNDQRWRVVPGRADSAAPEQSSEIYQFALGPSGRPRFVTSTKVPGWLINQYAMSEWDGHLRVATTSGFGGDPAQQSSTVYVLRADGRTLRETGRLGGLGKRERIYAVRFTGDKAYVVTFRQIDPLYTVDLREPGAPRLVGELKITGYSAYLHPVDSGRLIGVGQEATDRGRVTGTQVSLFDVADPAKPTRIAQHHVPEASSEAEHDPHAFLYWPPQRLLVMPLDTANGPGALALRVTDDGLTRLGVLTHPKAAQGAVPVRRSLVVGDTLWTLSDDGLLATDLSTMERLGWTPLT